MHGPSIYRSVRQADVKIQGHVGGMICYNCVSSMSNLRYAYCIIYIIHPICDDCKHLIKHTQDVLRLHMVTVAVTVTTEVSHSSNKSSLLTKGCYVLQYGECEVIYTNSSSSKTHFQFVGWQFNNNPFHHQWDMF